jgi:hypothetical protein
MTLLERAATLNVLHACNAIESGLAQGSKDLLVRIVWMLTKMASRSAQVREEPEYAYAHECEYDTQDNRQPEVPGDT